MSQELHLLRTLVRLLCVYRRATLAKCVAALRMCGCSGLHAWTSTSANQRRPEPGQVDLERFVFKRIVTVTATARG